MHHIGKLVQRGPCDGQHIRRPFKTGAAVFGAQQVGQTFQHVDTDRPRARRTIAGHQVMSDRNINQIGDRHQTCRRAFGEFVQPIGQGPQDQTQPCRRRFQQQRQKHRVLTEAHAMLAQLAACILIKCLYVIGNGFTRDNPHCFDQLERHTARHARQRVIARHGQQRVKQRRNLAVDEVLQAAAHFVGHVMPCFVIDKGHDLRAHGVIAFDQLTDSRVAPHQPTLFGEIEFGIGGVIEFIRAQMENRNQRRDRGLTQHAGFFRRGGCVLTEAEPFQLADQLPFDGDFALVVHFSHKALLLLQPAHQHRCAPVNKSLCQSVMQGIRQAVFYSARCAAPMVFVINPCSALRDIGPGPDIGQSFRERVNVAVSPVNACDIARQPVWGDSSVPLQELEHTRQQPRMFGGRNAAKIWNAAHIPQQPQIAPVAQSVDNLWLGGQGFQRDHIIGVARPSQPVIAGGRFQRRDQPRGRSEIHPRIAPVQFAHRQEFVVLDGGDDLIR